MSPGKSKMARWLRVSGVLLILGLIIEAISLRYNHPLSFMGFAMIGCGFLFFGVVLFLYLLVQVAPPE